GMARKAERSPPERPIRRASPSGLVGPRTRRHSTIASSVSLHQSIMSGSSVGDNLRVLHPVPRGHGLSVANRLTRHDFEPMTTRRILRNGRQMSYANNNFYQRRIGLRVG